MAKLTALWLLVVISLGMSPHVLTTRDSMRAVIPSSLIECYRNQRLLTKDNLLPMTMPVLIDLIRKVESFQGMNADMRVLTTTLLQRFRLDGIERDPEVMGNDYVIPYRPAGSEFYKFRFLMDSLIPNQAYVFPNASLNMVEQCTLHWMLSSSIDRWVRGDEASVCNRLSNHASWNSRIKRQVTQPPEKSADPDVEVLDKTAYMNDMARKPSDGYQQYQPSFAYPRGALSSDFSLSSCPIENGVVFTNYGAVKPGIVLAGIAAGLQPQTVSRNNLVQAIIQQGRMVRPPQTNVNNYNPMGGTDYSVSNTWASTLSGEVAEVAILQGPAYRQAMRIGLNGGWNNTLVPRYYFLSEESKDALTEADIRGAIDGLLMANNVLEWTRMTTGSLKLSQLLEMYYSEYGVYDVNNKACMRKDRFNQIAPISTLQRETENFAFVLQYEQPSAVNLEPPAIQELAGYAVTKLTSAVSSMSEPPCSTLRQSVPTPSPAADLYIVIDSVWEFISIQGILSSLIEKCDVNPYGSRVTLINGKDGSVMVNTTQHIADFHQNFTLYSYNMYPRGFDLGVSLRELQVLFEIEANRGKQSVSGNYQYNKYYDNTYDSYSSSSYGRQSSSYGSSYSSSSSLPSKLPKVVIFIPSNTAGSGDGNSNYIRDRIWYFRTNIPDVKLLYFVSGSKERYSQYAEYPNKDIFTLTMSSTASDYSSSLTPLISRIAEVPRPIINPTCGSSWVGRWYSNIQTTSYLLPNTIHYYKIHPNYFYKPTDAKIRIQSQGSVTLNVCQSRSNPLPNGNRTMGGGDVYCKQVSSDTFELRIYEGSCGDLYAFQCQPYYLSVSVSQSQSGSSNNLMCSGEECRFPSMIKYTITHEGLTCYSGVIKVISNPVLIIVLIFISIKDYF